MNNFLFLKIAKNRNSGLCNQLYNLVGSIEDCIKNNKNIIVIDNFLKQIDSDQYCPISKIIDLKKFNLYLSKYNILLFDKNDIKIEILSLKLIIPEYKTQDPNQNPQNNIIQNKIIILDSLLPSFLSESTFHIPKKRSFISEIIENTTIDIPCKILITYKINNYTINHIIDLDKGIVINDFILELNKDNYKFIESPLLYFGHSSNPKLFSDIFKNITIKDYFNSSFFPENVKLNVIHLRLEQDAITHISKIEGKQEGEKKKELEKKYIEMIEKYIGSSDQERENVLVLTDDYNNAVVDFLSSNPKYNPILFDKKYKFRELNAIRDLLLSEKCNRCFIGVMESSFSYGIMFRISKQLDDSSDVSSTEKPDLSNLKCVIFDMLNTSKSERIYVAQNLIDSKY